MSFEGSSEEVLFIANRVANASSHEWPHIFEDLRRRRSLSKFMHGLNRLLNKPTHRDLAKSALKRFGLYHAG
jgi:hypothetical protein